MMEFLMDTIIPIMLITMCIGATMLILGLSFFIIKDLINDRF